MGDVGPGPGANQGPSGGGGNVGADPGYGEKKDPGGKIAGGLGELSLLTVARAEADKGPATP